MPAAVQAKQQIPCEANTYVGMAASVPDVIAPLIREYYKGVAPRDIAPQHIERREFGFGDFERTIAFRHMAFDNETKLHSYLVENAPAFVSYSPSEYEDPAGRPMESKRWMGSELLFDLDATDMKLSCQKEHGSSWVCQNCLDSVKAETIKLVEEFLIPDFGVAESEISVNFSGNRGYHVHVTNEEIYKLGPGARKKMTEYISGTGIDLKNFFPALGERGMRLEGPMPTDYGWGGRLARGVISALNGGEATLTALGIDKATARKLSKNKAEVVLGIATNGNWDKINIEHKADVWTNVLNGMAVKQSDQIDSNVTNDVYHIIRLPNSIHGKSGLASKKLRSFKEITGFDPMKEAVAFRKGEIEVVATSPQFSMGGMTFGPYKEEKVKLPAYAAAYLLLKKVATLPAN